jgi:ATP-dependent exoDNAse (exonuclease V) beta subunit
VVTFTERAASELRTRLAARLAVLARDADEPPIRREACARALAHLDTACIGTIHGFATEIVRANAASLGVDPRFTAAEEATSEALLRAAFEGWLAREGSRATSMFVEVSGGAHAARENLWRATRALVAHRHLDAPWLAPSDEPNLRAEALSARLVATAERARRGHPKDPLRRALNPLVRAGTRVDRGRLDATAIADELRVAARALRRARLPEDGSRAYAPNVARVELVDEVRTLGNDLDALERSISARLALDLRDRLKEVVDAYAQAKARRGLLDFDDLLLEARRALATRTESRAMLARRGIALLVDEFQDTDPVQAELLLLAASSDPTSNDPWSAPMGDGRFFAVGDPKQSIYRFRGADLGCYERVKRRVLEVGGRVATLSASFRSVPAIQHLVNAAFEPVLVADPVTQQAGYTPLVPSLAAAANDAPAIIALPVPEPYGRRGIAREAIARSWPNVVGSFVRELLRDPRRRVRCPRTRELVAIAPEHVTILVRSIGGGSSSMAWRLVEALERHGVPVGVAGDERGPRSSIVRALVVALRAIDRPGDPLALYATLRGPLFGFTDEVLLRHKQRFGLDPSCPAVAPMPEEHEACREALALLAQLAGDRARRAPEPIVRALVEATGAHVLAAAGPSPRATLDELDRLLDRASHKDTPGTDAFRAFVGELDRARLGPTPGDGSPQGVTLMTVHKAKGLEFPVVILGDPTARGCFGVDRWVDPERGLAALELAGARPIELSDHTESERLRLEAEAVRLAYVAATRARDLLAIPAIGDDLEAPAGGWLTPITRALEPEGEPRSPAPWAPVVGTDVVLARPNGVEPQRPIAPGLHRTRAGDVLFVDPRALARGPAQASPPRAPLAHLFEPGEADGADVAAARHAASARLDAVRTAAAVARFPVETVTSVARGAAHAELDALARDTRLEALERAQNRPAGTSFGETVHRVLAALDLDAPNATIARAVTAHARSFGLDRAACEAVTEAVSRTLGSELFARARRAHDVRRELPVTVALDADRWVDGVVDLAFREGDRWVVVDYKTDDPAHLSADALDRYRRQLALYRVAIARASSLETAGVLLFL